MAGGADRGGQDVEEALARVLGHRVGQRLGCQPCEVGREAGGEVGCGVHQLNPTRPAISVRPTEITRQPTMSNSTPERIIRVIGTMPDP